MGLGIAGMHSTGMAAMRMHARLTYDALWVTFSIFIAVGASAAALWIAFARTGLTSGLWLRLLWGWQRRNVLCRNAGGHIRSDKTTVYAYALWSKQDEIGGGYGLVI
jgi:hypothetical protein